MSTIKVEAGRRASAVGRGIRSAKTDVSQCTWPSLDVEERSRPVGRDGSVVGFGDQGSVGMGDCRSISFGQVADVRILTHRSRW